MRTLNFFDFLVIVFGTINLLRLTAMLIGSDLYALKMHLKKKNLSTSTSNQPFITIIIPAYNEEKTILRTLTSILQNNYSTNSYEVILANDGSTDQTAHLTEEFKRDHPFFNLKIVSLPNQGKASTLNNIIKNHARGELIMCLDADSILTNNALSKIPAYFSDPAVQGLCANVKILPENNFLNYLQRYEYLICYQMKRAHDYFNMEYIIGGIGSVFRKKMLEQVGYYDTNTVTEDIDLTMKIIRNGNKQNKIVYAYDVITYTESVLNLKSLINQRFRWKWGRLQTFYKNPEMFFNSSPIFTKTLTLFQLPYALYGDISFVLEPVLVIYILSSAIIFNDWFSLISAWITVSSYLALSIIADDTSSITLRIKHVLLAPLFYFFFYILSLVEYIALIKSLIKLNNIPRSIEQSKHTWIHVERSGKAQMVLNA